jgi:hypothetical protein
LKVLERQAERVDESGDPQGPVVRLGEPRLQSLRPGGAVRIWALAGAVWIVFALVTWGRWVFSADQFTPQPKGPDDIPMANLIFINGYQVFVMVGLAGLVVHYLVKPWIRDRRLSLDGMLLIGSSFAFCLDGYINIFRYTFGWNAYAVNLGAWGKFLPGSLGSHRYGEGLLWAWPDYIAFSVVGAVAGCKLLFWLRRRFPRMTIVGGMTIFWVAFFVISSLVEIIRVRFELYSYARTWSGLTLWDGKPYQWPLYEGFFTACGASCFVYLRWSWLTKGRSFLDSGIDQLRVSERARQAILLLAVCGFSTVVWGICYFLPWGWTSISADSIADLPSYMLPG